MGTTRVRVRFGFLMRISFEVVIGMNRGSPVARTASRRLVSCARRERTPAIVNRIGRPSASALSWCEHDNHPEGNPTDLPDAFDVSSKKLDAALSNFSG